MWNETRYELPAPHLPLLGLIHVFVLCLLFAIRELPLGSFLRPDSNCVQELVGRRRPTIVLDTLGTVWQLLDIVSDVSGLPRQHNHEPLLLVQTNDIATYEHYLPQRGSHFVTEYAFTNPTHLSRQFHILSKCPIAISPYVQTKNRLVSFICLRHRTHRHSRWSIRPLVARQSALQSSLHQRHIAACMQGMQIVSIFCS